MTYSPKIIKISVMYIFTMPFPPGSVGDLIPPEKIFSGEIEVYYCGNDYFTYTIETSLRSGPRTDEEREQEIDKALDHIWEELVTRELVTGDRPPVIAGNPLDMLRT